MAKRLEAFDTNLLKWLETELNQLKSDYGKFKEDTNLNLKGINE